MGVVKLRFRLPLALSGCVCVRQPEKGGISRVGADFPCVEFLFSGCLWAGVIPIQYLLHGFFYAAMGGV